MAKESVIYLKVESKFYDDKLKRAVQGMQHFEQQCEQTGKSLSDADQKTVEYIKALGDMGTVATSSTGKLNELTKAFTELSVQYQKMSAAEKKSAPGQALAASLNKLKGRIGELKGQIDTAKGSLGSVGEAAKQLGGKLGIPTELFTKMGPAVAGAAAALKIAKDAFLATEQGVDAWGAACESAKASYSVFLNTLNNGNWSGFFTNIKEAITGANKLYDAMDRLASIKQNNMAAIAKEQATIQELRLRQEKGENVAKELREEEERLRKLQEQSVAQGKVAGEEQIRQVLTNAINSIKGNGGLFRRDNTAKVAEADIDAAIQDILKNGQAAMDKYAEQYSKLTEKATKTVTETHYSQGGQVYEVTTKSFDINLLSKEEQALYKLAKAITDSEGSLAAGIQTYATALQEGAAASREARKTETAAKKGETEANRPQTQAEEKVTKALEDYASALNIAAIRKEAGLDDEETYKSKELAAHERLFDAYTEAYNLYSDPKYKEAFDKEAAEILALAQTVKELKDAKEASKKAEQEAAQALRQQQGLDTRILGGLTGAAKKAGWSSSDLGLDGIKTKINAGVDITEEDWTVFQNKLNERLQSLGLDPIQINFETGNVEQVFDETKEQYEKFMNDLSSGVSAISTIGNSLGNLKGIGEDLASAFSGDMDAFDAMMTVFNSGISIFETVIGVLEAINTLTKLSTTLKGANAAASATQTAANEAETISEGEKAAASGLSTVANEAETISEGEKAVASGAATVANSAEAGSEIADATASGTATIANQAETISEGEKAVASGVATAANTAEAASGAGKAVSWIPIVGPMLAIAAIAAVLAAIMSAQSKSKSAGKFANGGIVPGNSYSGDRLNAAVNSGELIMSVAQQNNVASALQNNNPMGNISIEGRISGKDIILAASNFQRQIGVFGSNLHTR